MRKRIFLAAAAVAFSGGPAAAHHSFAEFDAERLVVLKGTLVKFSFMNPHSWISIMGSADEKAPPERWDIEATSPASLVRIGIHVDTLKPGDALTVAFRPLRDGRHGGSLVFLVTPDGVTHGAKPDDLGLKGKPDK